MTTRLNAQKAALRIQIRAAQGRILPAGRATASAQACSLLGKQAVWKKAQSVLFFAPLPEEPDIWPMVQAALAGGKIVALPRFVPETNAYAACRVKNPASDIRSGQFGIREPNECCAPVPSNRFDLILVPGMAFDLRGHRLGRGKGFYDQLLGLVRGTKCGVAFDEQIVAEIPVEAHDMQMNCLLTPTRWVEM
jgi:5-formyltetrahydrofolate cyclo-ligase